MTDSEPEKSPTPIVPASAGATANASKADVAAVISRLLFMGKSRSRVRPLPCRNGAPTVNCPNADSLSEKIPASAQRAACSLQPPTRRAPEDDQTIPQPYAVRRRSG